MNIPIRTEMYTFPDAAYPVVKVGNVKHQLDTLPGRFEIQDDPRFSIKYSDEKVFYNEDHEVFMQAVGEVELFEGKAVVYFQIALGE